MSDKQPERAWLVIQAGGSSMEWYSCTYDTYEEAEEAVHNHREATYDALGPYEVELPVDESSMLAILDEVLPDVAMFNVSKELCTNYLEWRE